MRNTCILSLFLLLVKCCCTTEQLVGGERFSFPGSKVPAKVQEEAVTALLKRKLPDKYQLFQLTVDPDLGSSAKDTFRIVSPSSYNDSRVHITGTTGVAAAWGLLHYLKYHCHCHVSWQADQLSLPHPLPKAQVKVVANDRFRYYQNVCTSSYSFVWWSWSQWEDHIDWMAMNGLNFPLAFTGQEAIWRKVYLKMNFTEADLHNHFAGPAFLAWGRMGNIKSWGGSLSLSWHSRSLSLQKLILRRMRQLGMTPILPAFAGHVPDAITRLYPEAKVTRLGNWGQFIDPALTGTMLLDPLDPLFQEIGSRFIEEMISEFNTTDHYFNCDTFNENTPPSRDRKYIQNVGSAVFRAMQQTDPEAIWVMQGWLFRDPFWNRAISKALLTSVPKGKMIVLDLMAETYPQYARLKSFYGQPFIFCMLHNFGGVNGLYGNVEMLVKQIKAVRSYPNATIVGTGLTPEGINQNYVMYDLMCEFGWRKPRLNVNDWATKYSLRRYGNYSQNLLGESWRLLVTSIYNSEQLLSNHGGYLLVKRPTLSQTSDPIWYDVSTLLKAWNLMIQASQEQMGLESRRNAYEPDAIHFQDNTSSSCNGTGVSCPCLNCQATFRHDLVDVTRQVLQVYAGCLVVNLRTAYKQNKSASVVRTGNTLIELLEDMDRLLLSSKDFLLGSWLKDAQSTATTPQETEQYTKNALHQITLWGPNGEVLDYATKQWSGVMEKYHKPRWELFIKELLNALQSGHTFNEEMFIVDVFSLVEKPFALDTNQTYPSSAQGDTIEIAMKIHEKYGENLRKEFTSIAQDGLPNESITKYY